ncbi:hypothetical protein EGJ31_23055 [Serratia marcescens]|uniref:hypothetical protein n=1 Tax=Serratia marcescens TaxID=615 RepID=UPI000F73BD17|nr:hypothetical protein [Serratia marcescens]RRU14476.1 hypothetical protein EGJ16_21430 [Serratia marcescens]RRU16525.1 hypothetical protein EGJ10_23350 [Serratia marcescens]RRU26361.1 hypothetical protein EGJ02_22905 [Serratia marcescens]RRU27884.1 hypothetical protein EGJ31_23055 [Serratia marcescens]RRU39746.1 hypothetical protein EGJ04_23300 [Serratia marcescens]
MMYKLSAKMLNFSLARPYLCLTIGLVFIWLSAGQATEYLYSGRHLIPFLLCVSLFAFGGVFVFYFFMRHSLLMVKVHNLLLKNESGFAEGELLACLEALAKRNNVGQEFEAYLSEQMHPQKVEVCMDKIRELTLKKRNDLSR